MVGHFDGNNCSELLKKMEKYSKSSYNYLKSKMAATRGITHFDSLRFFCNVLFYHGRGVMGIFSLILHGH